MRRESTRQQVRSATFPFPYTSQATWRSHCTVGCETRRWESRPSEIDQTMPLEWRKMVWLGARAGRCPSNVLSPTEPSPSLTTQKQSGKQLGIIQEELVTKVRRTLFFPSRFTYFLFFFFLFHLLSASSSKILAWKSVSHTSCFRGTVRSNYRGDARLC